MNKSFMKFASVLCIAGMAMSTVVGCGKSASSNPAGGKTKFANKNLEIAVFEGGYGKAYYDEIIKKFEAAYPGVNVTMTASPKIQDIIQPRIVAGNPPDVLCEFNTDKIGQLASEGALADLTDVFNSNAIGESKPLKDKMLDGVLDMAKPLKDGKIYYAPTTEGASGIYYNSEYFNSKGWKAPNTWDEFFAYEDLAKKEGKALFTYQGIYPSYNENILFPAIASHAGMDAIKKIENYEDGAWKDPKVKEVLNIFYKIAQDGDLMKGTVAMNHTQAQTEFLKGSALFIPNGSWFENEMKDAIPKSGFKFGFIPTPVFKNGDKQYIDAGCGYDVVPKKAKNPELAKEFIKFQYTNDAIKLMAQKNSAVMAVKGSIDMVKDMVPESVYTTFKAYDHATPIDIKFAETSGATIKIKDEIFNPISSIMNKKLTVDQWADRIEKADATLRTQLKK